MKKNKASSTKPKHKKKLKGKLNWNGRETSINHLLIMKIKSSNKKLINKRKKLNKWKS